MSWDTIISKGKGKGKKETKKKRKQDIKSEDFFKFIKLLLLFKKIFGEGSKYSYEINILIDKYAVNCNDSDSNTCNLTKREWKNGRKFNILNEESNKFKELNSNVKTKLNTNAKKQFNEMLKEYSEKYKLENEIPQINY